MPDTLKMGVLGAGRMGSVHCELIRATEGLELVAASSRATELATAAAERFGIRSYTSHEELLADDSIDWIVISTTSDLHHHWAFAALDAGKELIVEKPIALSYREAVEIYDAAERKGLRVIPHQSRRWDRDFALVRRYLSEGSLGTVYRIESRRASYSSGWAGWGAQGMANPWRLKKQYGGGMLNDWAPHLLDQLFLLAEGRVRSVYAWLGGRLWTSEVDDHFWAELLFDDGLSARVEASNNYRIPLPRWTLVGSDGTLQVAGAESDHWSQLRVVHEPVGIREVVCHDLGGEELANGFYEDFARTIREGCEHAIRREQVLLVMRIIDLIKESARTNKTIDLTD